MPTAATLEPHTDAGKPPSRLCWQTIDDRFSLRLEYLQHEMVRASMFDKQRPEGKRLRHSVLNWDVPSAIRKLKENVADSDFATDAEKAAAEKIREVEG